MTTQPRGASIPRGGSATTSANRLHFAGRDRQSLAAQTGTPAFVLPRMQEADFVALLNVGGYGSAAASNYCMRGTFSEHLLD